MREGEEGSVKEGRGNIILYGAKFLWVFNFANFNLLQNYFIKIKKLVFVIEM